MVHEPLSWRHRRRAHQQHAQRRQLRPSPLSQLLLNPNGQTAVLLESHSENGQDGLFISGPDSDNVPSPPDPPDDLGTRSAILEATTTSQSPAIITSPNSLLASSTLPDIRATIAKTTSSVVTGVATSRTQLGTQVTSDTETLSPLFPIVMSPTPTPSMVSAVTQSTSPITTPTGSFNGNTSHSHAPLIVGSILAGLVGLFALSALGWYLYRLSFRRTGESPDLNDMYGSFGSWGSSDPEKGLGDNPPMLPTISLAIQESSNWAGPYPTTRPLPSHLSSAESLCPGIGQLRVVNTAADDASTDERSILNRPSSALSADALPTGKTHLEPPSPARLSRALSGASSRLSLSRSSSVSEIGAGWALLQRSRLFFNIRANEKEREDYLTRLAPRPSSRRTNSNQTTLSRRRSIQSGRFVDSPGSMSPSSLYSPSGEKIIKGSFDIAPSRIPVPASVAQRDTPSWIPLSSPPKTEGPPRPAPIFGVPTPVVPPLEYNRKRPFLRKRTSGASVSGH